VAFFYGSVGDNPTTFKKDVSPNMAEPHVLVTETSDPDLRLLAGRPMGYVPPDGSVVITAGGSGFLVRDGLYITIQATDDGEILSIARALRPIPSAGNAGGG
jgi:hypothetical protein